jgi:two-component system nitrogen regulation response regulator NtrX
MTDAIDLLVVDDDADAREMLGEFCTSLGFRVALAHDGRAALIALRRATPSFPVVIADLHMPHADGFEVLAAARDAHATCYVVVITGYATIDVAVQAVRAGAYDLLAKPFSLAQLELVLARIRDRMSLESENRQLTGHGRSAVVAATGDRSVESRLLALEQRLATLEAMAVARPVLRTLVSENR